MNFDDLERQMRTLETAQDPCASPDVALVVRLDGRSFTRLTKELLAFERPFDVRFRDAMLATVEHLMQIGLRVDYAYTESDEISLLLPASENAFGRKLRKLNSVLAGEASARFSLSIGSAASFDCRVSELASKALVLDYFRWRQEDASRNALNAYCYWTERGVGRTARQADAAMKRATLAQKLGLLLRNGVDYGETPVWQRRGVALYWETFEKIGTNPLTGGKTVALRQRVRRELELPAGDAYTKYLEQRLFSA